MTITVSIQCDGFQCGKERELNDVGDSSIEAAGWHTDPHDEFTHYCSICWPVVKKELEEELTS